MVPFLKWAGGKRWFISQFPGFFPKKYNRYIEPFLGSGAVYFSLQPASAILADANINLISTYRAIKDDPEGVVRELEKHHGNHSSEYYYNIRDAEVPSAPEKMAARFIYLNRTCWNGLYRVNLHGKFNVPIGTKSKVIMPGDDFKGVSDLLSSAELKDCDFEDVISMAEKDDFVFVDPPYTVKHNDNGFIKYNENLFRWDDQVRLRDSLLKAPLPVNL